MADISSLRRRSRNRRSSSERLVLSSHRYRLTLLPWARQTGDFLVGHGASVWIKEIYSREQKRAALTFKDFMNASFVPGRMIVNKIKARRFSWRAVMTEWRIL